MEPADESLIPTPVPTPGRYYQIRKGDNLLGVAGKAYAVKAGTQARLDFARKINRHPLNRKYLKEEKGNNLFPEGQVSFLPGFSCDVPLQIAALQTAVKGNCFAVLWIPEAEEVKHPFLGKAIDIPSGLLPELLKSRASVEPESSQSEAMQSQVQPSPKSDAFTSEGLTMVSDPHVTPLRFICSVMAIFEHPRQKGTLIVSGPASGTLIGDRQVLTAAHVIYAEGFGLTAQDPVLIVTPGDDSLYKNSGPPPGLSLKGLPFSGLGAFIMGKSPVGSFVSTSAKFPNEFKNPTKAIVDAGTRHLFDYAVITLPKDVGRLRWKRKRFGYWGSARHGDGTRFLPQTNRDDLKDKTVFVTGYPVTEQRVAQHGITQWTGEGIVNNDLQDQKAHRKHGRERVGYRIPTEEGQSGSPVWRTVSSGRKTFFDLIAVHSNGGFELTFSANGVLLTPKVMENITKWMKES